MYYIDYSLNTNYMIRNLLKAANALTFSTMFLLLLAGCNKNTIIFEDGTTPNGSSGNEDPGNSTLVTFNASVEGRNLFTDILRRVAGEIFIPLTVGGGIRTLEDFDRVLKCGADKVSVNSGALRDPDLIPAAARRYGNQCVVLSADVKRVNGQFRVFAKGGREDTGRDALDWIRWCVDHGAGEICLNSIDTDGVRNGFDLEMLDAVAARVDVPIIASGGAGKKEDFLELFHHKGIDAGLAAGIFHQKLLTIRDLKEYLAENGVEMRL